MSQEPREGLVSRRRLSALFNEVTRPLVEKWSLDCARSGESLSHLAGGWRQKLDPKTVTESQIICP